MEIQKSNKLSIVVITLIMALVIISATLITYAAFDDFWLDEIFSLRFAKTLVSPIDVLIRPHQYNSHILNTLYLHYLGDQYHWIWYRALSVICGILSLMIIGFIQIRKNAAASIVAVSLAAFSYPLILYFSEARGYAMAIFMSLLAYGLIQYYWRDYALWKLILFWVAVILGFLAQSVFFITYLSISAWMIYHEMRSTKNIFAVRQELAKCHLVPLALVSLVYFFYIRSVIVSSGPDYTLSDVIQTLVIFSVGAPKIGYVAWACVLGVLAISVYAIVRLYKEKMDHWVFFLFVLFIAPAVMLVFKPQIPICFRFFIVCIPFFYILVSYLAGSLWSKSRVNKIVIICLLALFLIGQINRLIPFLTLGRGQYSDALTYMSDLTVGSDIIVGSDHDFRNKEVLDFYSRYLPIRKHIVYIEKDSLAKMKPDWFITHSLEEGYRPEDKIEVSDAGYYYLARSFPYGGGSGFSWFVYRRDLGSAATSPVLSTTQKRSGT